MQSAVGLSNRRAPPSRRYRSEHLRDQKLTTAAPRGCRGSTVCESIHRVALASVTEGHLPLEGTGVSRQPGRCKVGYRGILG